VPPSPNRLDEDISEIMQKEGSDNDSQTGEEDGQPSKRMRMEENQQWEEMNFLAETPVSLLSNLLFVYRLLTSSDFRAKLLHQTLV